MRVMVSCVVAAACGPGLGHPNSNDVAKDSLLDASGDAEAFEHLMRESVLDGGILFSDPSCARDFGQPREVPPPQFHALATCLAGLHLTAGERTDSLGDVAVLTYPPGVELEARVMRNDDGRRLRFIGFAGRFDTTDPRPTIAPSLLESLRELGTMHPPLDGVDPDAYAWLRVCIDDNGNPDRVTPIEATSKKVARMMEAAAGAWKFKPSPVGAACSTVAVGHPKPDLQLPLAPNKDQTIRIPISAFHRKTGDANILPDDNTKSAMAKAKYRGRWVGTFKMCIDGSGAVTTVDVVRSTESAAYDRTIMRTIKQSWSFQPLDGGDPGCTGVSFIYAQL